MMKLTWALIVLLMLLLAGAVLGWYNAARVRPSSGVFIQGAHAFGRGGRGQFNASAKPADRAFDPALMTDLPNVQKGIIALTLKSPKVITDAVAATGKNAVAYDAVLGPLDEKDDYSKTTATIPPKDRVIDAKGYTVSVLTDVQRLCVDGGFVYVRVRDFGSVTTVRVPIILVRNIAAGAHGTDFIVRDMTTFVRVYLLDSCPSAGTHEVTVRRYDAGNTSPFGVECTTYKLEQPNMYIDVWCQAPYPNPSSPYPNDCQGITAPSAVLVADQPFIDYAKDLAKAAGLLPCP